MMSISKHPAQGWDKAGAAKMTPYGYIAVMQSDRGVVSGFANKLQATFADVIPVGL